MSSLKDADGAEYNIVPGWRLETGTGGFGEKGDRWVCVRNLESQCGQDFYEDRDMLAFNFLRALADAHEANSTDALRAEVAELAQQRGDLAAKVLELEAEVSRLTTHMTVPTVEPESQHWAGMDGAIAFQLIERHADNWADIGRMMGEWLAANQTVNVASESQPSEQTR